MGQLGAAGMGGSGGWARRYAWRGPSSRLWTHPGMPWASVPVPSMTVSVSTCPLPLSPWCAGTQLQGPSWAAFLPGAQPPGADVT